MKIEIKVTIIKKQYANHELYNQKDRHAGSFWFSRFMMFSALTLISGISWLYTVS